jgi:type VI secretion system protein ImpK
MSSDDPFSDSGNNDGTVIRPTPGRRSGGGTQQHQPVSPGIAPQPPPAAAYGEPPRGAGIADYSSVAGHIAGSGLNPLVDAATALLVLAGQLRNTVSHSDVAGLREHVVQQVKLFEQTARGQGVTPETLLAARYLLCTFLDETVLSTPWGSESVWSTHTLLSTFHNETWGGEKFFLILERMLQEPGRHRDILELIYLCLSLGFQGKYGVQDQGRSRLADVQDKVYQAIRMQRGDLERDLSPHWKGIEDRRTALVRYVPLWVVAAIAGVLLLVTYAGFRFILENSSAPVYDSLDKIGRAVDAEKEQTE